MQPIERMVFPVDFSERCHGASHFAAALAGRFQADLTLLHVVEPAHYVYGSPEFGGSALGNFHAQRLADSARELDLFAEAEFPAFNPQRVVLEGDPAHRIVEYARRSGADLILLPTHGLGAFRRILLGSVTAKILHDAECAVWTGVHTEDAPPLEKIRCRNLICAVDLGPHSEAPMLWAARLAAEYQAGLWLVHATPAIESWPTRQMDSEIRTELEQDAHARLERMRDQLGIVAGICVHGGDPAKVVRYAAEQHQADLAVIGRGSSEGLGRLRAHSYAIIRNSPCPVVSV